MTSFTLNPPLLENADPFMRLKMGAGMYSIFLWSLLRSLSKQLCPQVSTNFGPIRLPVPVISVFHPSFSYLWATITPTAQNGYWLTCSLRSKGSDECKCFTKSWYFFSLMIGGFSSLYSGWTFDWPASTLIFHFFMCSSKGNCLDGLGKAPFLWLGIFNILNSERFCHFAAIERVSHSYLLW